MEKQGFAVYERNGGTSTIAIGRITRFRTFHLSSFADVAAIMPSSAGCSKLGLQKASLGLPQGNVYSSAFVA
jgi:hypothetical protein